MTDSHRFCVSFVPLVVETLGGWDADAIFHLRAIAKQSAARSPLLVSRNCNSPTLLETFRPPSKSQYWFDSVQGASSSSSLHSRRLNYGKDL